MRSVLPLAALLLTASACSAQTSVDEAIRGEVEAFVDAINSGSAAAVEALYLDGPATGSIGDGTITRGKDAVSQLLTGIYRQYGVVRLAASNVVVTPAGADAAIAYFDASWSFGAPVVGESQGAMTIVFVRTPAGWRVAHDHTSSLPGAASPVSAAQVPEGGPATPVRTTTACRVTRVVDGDTLDCAPVGRVRLIGMDAPESDQEPFGQLSAQILGELIPVDSEVALERDVEARDQYDRALGYIWTDAGLVNWILVRTGYAVVLTYPPNVQYVESLEAAQRAARDDAVGLWAVDGFACEPRDHRADRC